MIINVDYIVNEKNALMEVRWKFFTKIKEQEVILELEIPYKNQVLKKKMLYYIKKEPFLERKGFWITKRYYYLKENEVNDE